MEEPQQGDGIAGRHQTARQTAERAVAASRAGNQDEADRLFADAARLDPVAVATVLAEHQEGASADTQPASDEEVAAMSRTVEPHQDAPSRAGITGSGSGADDEAI